MVVSALGNPQEWRASPNSNRINFMEERFFHRLVSIPLFQGLCMDDFIEIAERVHFDFRTLSEGDTIIEEGDSCDHMVCSISGTVCKEERCDNGAYLFREFTTTPMVMQPERLFGLRPRHTAAFIAASEVQMLSIPKQEVRDILFECMPVHINYLNLVCTAQHLWESRLWKPLPETLEQRFVHFLLLRATRPAGQKELLIDMIALAGELLTTRLRVSQMLNRLKDLDLLELRRRHIIIPSLEKLIQYVQNPSAH